MRRMPRLLSKPVRYLALPPGSVMKRASLISQRAQRARRLPSSAAGTAGASLPAPRSLWAPVLRPAKQSAEPSGAERRRPQCRSRMLARHAFCACSTPLVLLRFGLSKGNSALKRRQSSTPATEVVRRAALFVRSEPRRFQRVSRRFSRPLACACACRRRERRSERSAFHEEAPAAAAEAPAPDAPAGTVASGRLQLAGLRSASELRRTLVDLVGSVSEACVGSGAHHFRRWNSSSLAHRAGERSSASRRSTQALASCGMRGVTPTSRRAANRLRAQRRGVRRTAARRSCASRGQRGWFLDLAPGGGRFSRLL